MARWLSARAADLHRSGRAAAARGDYAGAQKEATIAVRLDPTRAEYLLLRSEALAGLDRHAEAVADAEAAIRLEPSGTAYFDLGIGLSGLGKHADALGVFNEAAKRGVDEVRVLEQLVFVHEKLNNTKEAERAKKRLQELKRPAPSPKNPNKPQ